MAARRTLLRPSSCGGGGGDPRGSGDGAPLLRSGAPGARLALSLAQAVQGAGKALARELRTSANYHVAEVAEEYGVPELRRILNPAAPSKVQPEQSEAALPRGRTHRRALGLSLPMLGLVVVCIVVEASKGLLANWEINVKATRGLERPSAPLMVFAKNVASVLTGVVFAFLLGGRASVAAALNPVRVLAVLPPATLSATAQVCSLLALNHFDVGCLKVFAQLSLPATAVLSRFVLGRRYSLTQWQAIAFLALCSVAFIEVRILFETTAPSPLGLALGLTTRSSSSAEDPDISDALRPGGSLEGLGYVLLAVLLGSVASVLGERFLKRDQRAFYVQKCNLMLGECLASLLVLLMAPRLDHRGAAPRTAVFSFAGWDWRTSLVVLVWLTHGWVAGMVAKQLSSLTKSIAHIMSAMVSYVIAAVLWPRAPFFPRGLPATLTAVMVFLSVLIFSTIKPPKPAPAGPPPGDPLPRHENGVRAEREAAVCKPPAKARSCAQGAASLLSGHALLLTAFVMLEGTRPLLVSWAQQGENSGRAFRNGTFVLTQTSTSFLVAVGIAWTCERSLRRALRTCMMPRAILRLLPVACCFTASKFALLTALSQLDAGTVRVMAQSGLPMVAVGSCFLGKRYSQLQWQAIWMIGLGVVAFFMVKTEAESCGMASPASPHKDYPAGTPCDGEVSWRRRLAVCSVFVSLGANCLGALTSERFLKSTTAWTPYYAQKAHLLGGECVANFGVFLFSWLFRPSPRDVSVLAHVASGWDHRTVITMLVWIPSGWCATLVVKRCSVLSKNIAQSAGSLLTYLFSVQPITLVAPALKPQPVVVPVLLLALVCIQSVVLFVVASAEEETIKKQKQLQLHLESLGAGSGKALLVPSKGIIVGPELTRMQTPPILSIDMWQDQWDDPIGQIDFVGPYSPLLLPPRDTDAEEAVLSCTETGSAHQDLAAAVPSRGPGLLRVSTVGAELYELAMQAPSGYDRQFTPGDVPIGQTDFMGSWSTHRR